MAAGDSTSGEVRTMKASDFKARCLALMDEIAESGEEIVITKRGRPVAKLSPCGDRPRTLFGAGGALAIHGDISEPIDAEWEAEADPDRVLNP